MNKLLWTTSLLAALAVSAAEIKAPVTGVMIFKNGVSAVRRTADMAATTTLEREQSTAIRCSQSVLARQARPRTRHRAYRAEVLFG